jgi:3-hydroxybutyryl-CoA dehydrogenase
MTDRTTIAVVGAGLMGHGIAWLFAAAGHEVRVFDAAPEARAALPARLGAIDTLLGVARSGAVSAHERLADCVAGAGFVVEAAPEKLALKQALFAEVEPLVPGDCILASNTSALPIGRLSERMADRSRLVGTHFWNPPHLVPLVEVVETEFGNLAAVERTVALLRAAGRHPVHVRRDIPGFIGNRLQHALKREAIALVANGICSAETVDDVVKLGFGSRLGVLGPLEQSDLVGLDLTLDIHETLIADLDVSAGPHPLLREHVAEGRLGMKTGEGFRRWTREEADAVRRRLSETLAAAARRRLGTGED